MDDNELLDKSKVPVGKKNYVGIEIEFLMSERSEPALRRALIKKGLQWNVNLGTDGSVDDDSSVNDDDDDWYYDYREGYEMRILAEESEAPSIVRSVCTILAKLKAKVNKTCGLHVHIDMRHRKYEFAFDNFYKCQDLMFSTQPKSRRKNEYCEKLTTAIKKSQTYNRRYAINRLAYGEHRTIEIRLHEGSINADDILMWTGFLIEIADMKTIKTKVTSVDDLNLPKALKEHLNDRIQRFSSAGKKNSVTA